MAMELFSTEYNYVRDCLKDATLGDFSSPLKKHLDGIKNILGEDGPDVSQAKKLDAMRWALFFKHTDKIMKSAGIDTKVKTGSVGDNEVVRVSVIKFLRHLYLINRRGNQQVWVFSSPAAYTQYPTDELWASKSNRMTVRDKIDDTRERFSKRDKKNLSDATQLGLKWAMQAWITLANATTEDGAASMEKVRKWFAESTTSEATVNATIANVREGFKKVVKTLNSTQIVFTDMASLRNATNGDDADFRESEAFVYSGRHERLPIIYIEDAFFSKGGNVMDGIKNWARIIVHECTHLDCSTDDKLYAWAGIRPGRNITAAECAVNADSWAYFAADCANALTDSDINRAMVGI